MSDRGMMQLAYVADGFADDCDELVYRCSKVDMLTYEFFCLIWKEMHLASIFHGRPNGAELAELSEEVLHVAKNYMVAETNRFEESVAGLFLVYALLNLQPFSRFASVRFVQEDLPAIQRLEMGARRQKRRDVLYILGSVLLRGPVEFHAAARERAMEHPIRKYLEGYASVDRVGGRPKGVFLRQHEEVDILQELNGLARRYTVAKSAVSDKRNLNYTSDTLMTELDSSLKRLITGIIDKDEDGDSDSNMYSKPTMSSIKEKAMKTKVQPMRHLVAVESKHKEGIKTKSPQKKPIKKPLKRNTSPNLIDTKVHVKKRRQTFKKNKRPPSVAGSSDSEYILPDGIPNKSSTITVASQNLELTSELPEQEVDIQIDSLPCVITSEQSGKYFEIEIIDQLKNKAETSTESRISEIDVPDEKVDAGEPKLDYKTANNKATSSNSKKRKIDVASTKKVNVVDEKTSTESNIRNIDVPVQKVDAGKRKQDNQTATATSSKSKKRKMNVASTKKLDVVEEQTPTQSNISNIDVPDKKADAGEPKQDNQTDTNKATSSKSQNRKMNVDSPKKVDAVEQIKQDFDSLSPTKKPSPPTRKSIARKGKLSKIDPDVTIKKVDEVKPPKKDVDISDMAKISRVTRGVTKNAKSPKK